MFENISLAISSLRAGKMRALLTMLGIIIGVGSVIAIVTVGNALSNSVNNLMEEFGINYINITLQQREANTEVDVSPGDRINDDMIQALEKRFGDQLDSIELTEQAGAGRAKEGRKYANVSIYGTSPNYIKNSGLDIVAGRDLTQQDILSAKSVAVVSDKLVNKLFPGHSGVGKEIKVQTGRGMQTFVIVGVYSYELPTFVASFMPDEDVSTDMTIPVTTAKKNMGAEKGYTYIALRYHLDQDAAKLTDEVQTFMEQLYKNNKRFTIYAYNMESQLTQMTSMMGTISTAIAIIAAISLLVGGIGVMNIMLVSVTERTREIGTRKALGARNSSIRSQFIVESMIICLIGGIIGIVVGLLLGYGGSQLLGFSASPSIPIIIIAVGFSVLIGVFFGYYPANKAAKLDPIEALRYE